jgi:hypothetical protein
MIEKIITLLPNPGNGGLKLHNYFLGRRLDCKMTSPQIQMCSWSRQEILDRHDFFISEIKKRVFSQFIDVGGETDNYADNEYKRLSSMPGNEHLDGGDISEIVTDKAQDFYCLLYDLKAQMLLGSIAGMYHQWEKELRRLLQIELSYSYDQKEIKYLIWKWTIDQVFDALKEFGWDYKNFDHPSKLKACGLVVNVYKHGNGRSLDNLAKIYEEYINDPTSMSANRSLFNSDYLDYRWLSVSEIHFDEFAAALRTFWEDFPERLVLSQEPKVQEST